MASRIKVNRILVPTDFSELSLAALDYAVFVAGVLKADIYLLHVMESYDFNTVAKLDEEEAVAVLQEKLEKKVYKQFTQLRQLRKIDPSIKMFSRMAKGKIHEQIQRIVELEDIDLVIMGTHGASGLTRLNRFFLGSNANRTVQVASVPVLTLKESREPIRIENILLPLDLFKETTGKVGLAVNLATIFDAQVHLLAVTDYFEELRYDVSQLEEKMEAVAKSIRESNISCTTEVLRHESVSTSVLKYAEEVEADFILIMTGQENRFNSFVMGSRAQKIISSSPIPVLSFRPPSAS